MTTVLRLWTAEGEGVQLLWKGSPKGKHVPSILSTPLAGSEPASLILAWLLIGSCTCKEEERWYLLASDWSCDQLSKVHLNCPRTFAMESLALVWGPGPCVSNQLAGDSPAAGRGTTLGEGPL